MLFSKVCVLSRSITVLFSFKFTDGSYVYLEASNEKFGSRATLISKLFRATIGRTLKFYAYMYGRTVNYLKVFLRKQNSEIEEILKISGNQGKKWIKLKVRFASLIPYQVCFLLYCPNHSCFDFAEWRSHGGGRVLGIQTLTFPNDGSWDSYRNAIKLVSEEEQVRSSLFVM